MDPPCRDVAATSCRVVAATASVEVEGRVRRLERIVEQIGGVLVPQIMKGDVDGFVGEQIGGVPLPQIWEPIVEGPHLVLRERVQNRTPEQIMDWRTACRFFHRSACIIVRRSRSWVSLCLRSRRTAFRVYHRSACSFVRRSRLWIPLCLRSLRTACRSHHRSTCNIVFRSRLWVSSCL